MMRNWIIIGAVLAGLGVAIGAFGAHGLRPMLEANNRVDAFATATQYHQLHALAILVVVGLSSHLGTTWARRAAWGFVLGIGLFSGSLYALALSNTGIFGAVAPVGGGAFIAGWACLVAGAWRTSA